jgi:hypothetical protein
MAQAAVPDTKVEAAQNHPRKVRAPSEGSARFASAWELNGIGPGPSCPAGLADHAPHHSRSASGGGRAGNSIGASADSPIARSTGSIDRGAVITASNRREPSQCAHLSTSIANTRRIGDAHAGALKRRDGVRRARTVQNCSGVPNTRICRQHQGLADGPSARAQ